MKCKKCKTILPEDALYCHICGKKQTENTRKPLKRGNGTGTVYKLPGRRKKPWVAAKNRLIIGYYPTKQGALEVLDQYRHKSIDERINTTFEDAYNSWKKAHSKNVETHTADGYQYTYEYFLEIKNRKLRELRTSDFQQIIDKLISEGKSRSTMEKSKSLAKQICDWGIVEEIIQTNFAQYITLPKQIKKSKPIFTEDEIELLFSNDKNETVKIILIMMFTGLRIGEMMTMKKENVYLEEYYMIGGSKTEAGRNRTIPINDKILPYIRYFYEIAPDGGFLIDGYIGNKDADNFRKRDFNRVMKRLGIEGKSPHCARHTFASMMSKADARIENLQKIIGHSKYSTTAEIYIHPNVAKLKEEIDKI